MKFPRKSSQSGFTLVEMLMVVAIIALLLIAFLFLLLSQLEKARDARRKSDLDRIKKAFEEYYNDHNCYPDPSILNNCGGNELAPYIAAIPCDPVTKQPYFYLPLAGNQCGGYRLLTKLENEDDPFIRQAECDDECGCGYGSGYNYGVSSGVKLKNDVCVLPDPSPAVSPSPGVTPSPSPTPSSAPVSPSPSGPPATEYACDSNGVCNIYDEDQQMCNYTFQSAQECLIKCGTNPIYNCR